MRLTQRCRQCGWVHETETDRLPCHGVRVRCEECGSWLALLTPAAGEGEGGLEGWRGEDRRPGERRLGDRERAGQPWREEPCGGSERAAAPSASAVRELVRPWLREIARADRRPLTAELLFRDHGGDLRRLFDLWSAAYPGREAVDALREALHAELEASRAEGAGRP